MKRIIICLAAAIALHVSTTQAQTEEQEFSVGVGLEGGIVTGDFKDVYSAHTGITGRGAYRIGPGFATATTGILALIPKKEVSDDYKVGLIVPFKLGYKLIVQERFFVMGEVGYSTLITFYDDAYGLATSRSRGFTYAPAVGVQFGGLEIGLRYEATALKGATLSSPMLRLGYNF